MEQRTTTQPGATAVWTPIRHFDACNTLTKAMEWIEAEGKPGFYRIVQMQRAIWAENVDGKLQLRKSGNSANDTQDRLRVWSGVVLLTSATTEDIQPSPAPAAGRTIDPASKYSVRAPSISAFFAEMGGRRCVSYQPESQFAFFVERLAFVNLYSRPTEIAKFTSYCAYDVLGVTNVS